MDFYISEKTEALRKEIAEFASKELPEDWYYPGGLYDFSRDWDFVMEIAKKLGQRGWIASSWPKEYGGCGASIPEDFVIHDEMQYWGIPGTTMGAGGSGWIGQSILAFGTEEQKRKYLPPIAAGEPDGVWCTAYSEPDSGTDLPSLKTEAVRVGDEYIVNGEKTWITAAHRARWCWCLVRTNTDPTIPKHRGLTLLIIDMKSQGISIQPIVDVVGNSELSQVFFHDLHVPVANRVGEENRGWYYVAQALNFERSGIGIGKNIAFIRRFFEKIVSFAKETKYRGEPLSKNPIVRNKLAKLEIEIEIARTYCYKTAWLLEAQGQVPLVDAAIAKVLVSEILVRVAVTGMEILGQYAQLRKDSKWAKLNGIAQHFYLQSYAIKVGGGTNEIERDVIAQVGMGLPRSRR